jgi:hypothetical protein
MAQGFRSRSHRRPRRHAQPAGKRDGRVVGARCAHAPRDARPRWRRSPRTTATPTCCAAFRAAKAFVRHPQPERRPGRDATIAIGNATTAGKYTSAAAIQNTRRGRKCSACDGEDDAPLAAYEDVIMTIGAAALPGAGIVERRRSSLPGADANGRGCRRRRGGETSRGERPAAGSKKSGEHREGPAMPLPPSQTRVCNMALATSAKPPHQFDHDGTPLAKLSRRCGTKRSTRCSPIIRGTSALGAPTSPVSADFTCPRDAIHQAFEKPADCLRWLPWRPDHPDYFEGEEEGDYILSNAAAPIVVRYIARIDDIAKWSPGMRACWRPSSRARRQGDHRPNGR